MQIIPSLVEQTPQDLFAVITRLHPYYNRFQVDIEDGVFIQNKTLSVLDFSTYVKTHTSLLPPNIAYDFHLMTKNYKKDLALINELGGSISVGTVLIHTALHPPLPKIASQYPHLQIGLVINPDETIESVLGEFNAKSIPVFQIMTVYPGKQGQPFIEKSLDKIEQLKKASFEHKIYLDGAINEQSLPLIISRGFKPDALCPGSYLAKADNIEDRVKFLREQINQAGLDA